MAGFVITLNGKAVNSSFYPDRAAAVKALAMLKASDPKKYIKAKVEAE